LTKVQLFGSGDWRARRGRSDRDGKHNPASVPVRVQGWWRWRWGRCGEAASKMISYYGKAQDLKFPENGGSASMTYLRRDLVSAFATSIGAKSPILSTTLKNQRRARKTGNGSIRHLSP